MFATAVIAADTAAISVNTTYAELSAASLADPSNTALANQVELACRGDTLRGLGLHAVGFIGQIAL